MALMREEATTSPPNDDGKGNKDSFWLQLMAECEANSPNKLPSSKSLLFLGDNDAQKSQLVSRLQSSGEKYRKGNGLEYYYLNVRDEYGKIKPNWIFGSWMMIHLSRDFLSMF
ncbi:dynein light intermediate chain [Trichonephila inaurata madagascariensis]|uniref:Dynein light intermediate chain n=1 Tax=Trichonephila inaurata madagascariensis TaxID=2747483 RepID=A0A8X6YGE3_9ARAC|nr:dynein light intermediate chain [Trichonephila inaurata madagascariensis]